MKISTALALRHRHANRLQLAAGVCLSSRPEGEPERQLKRISILVFEA